jgi:hypothetical protein
MDIQTLVKNPFVIGGIVIVVIILLFGRYFLRLFKNQEILTIPKNLQEYWESTKCPVWTDELNHIFNGLSAIGNCDQLFKRGYSCEILKKATSNCTGCNNCDIK